ncbi:TrmH family RNA methyltransferase [Aestuariivivens sediminicola]|uniref:TrmH family RNA methyltransferase n=1 Tax=Aestuariivivens sediminicola TaxID=2913560 RepID=UPI001F5AD8D6|nr:RNA methyltransferase [Aestuariivivens sediminicola]
MIDLTLLYHLESYLSDRRRHKFFQVLQQRTKHVTVAIEDVYQLHNTSAVLRSCDVFGIQDLHVIEERNTKRIDREIAMGAQKWVDIHRYNSAMDCIKTLKHQGYQIVATTPHASDCALQDFDVTQKSCFFFGRETEGLSDEVIHQADQCLTIPMVGFTESLNISVSAAIILQQITSRLRQSDVPWQLSASEQLEKRLDWCKKTIKSYKDIVDRFYE